MIGYFVTQCRTKKPLEVGDRCIGYYKTIQEARNRIKQQDFSEAGYYQYGIIEAFSPGDYPDAKLEEWYILSKRGAKKIKKPNNQKHYCNYGIG